MQVKLKKHYSMSHRLNKKTGVVALIGGVLSKIFFNCTLNGAVLPYGSVSYGLHSALMKFGLLAGGQTPGGGPQ